MDLGANIMPVEVITERAFGGNYFRNIYLKLLINDIKTHLKNLMCY